MPPEDYEARLMVVSADVDSRDELTQSLDGWSHSHRVLWVSQPELAVSRALSATPHVILIDERVADCPERYVQQLKDCCPMSPIVAMVESGSIELANQMVLAGARAVLRKPLQPREVQRSLELLLSNEQTLVDRFPERPTGHVVALVSPRGGAGRTSLGCNLAIFLMHLQGRGVVLVDADMNAPAIDVMLNLSSAPTLADAFSKADATIDAELVDGILQRHASGLRVLVAPPAEQTERRPDAAQMEQLMMLLRRMVGWTLVDTGLPFDDVATSITDIADMVLLVFPPEMAAVRSAHALIKRLRERGYGDDKVRMVVTRSTVNTGIPLREIERRLGPVWHTIPDDPQLAFASTNRGVPVALRYPHSAMGKAYSALARKMVQTYTPSKARLSLMPLWSGLWQRKRGGQSA